MSTSETTLFLVHNGADYDNYSVLGLFTDKGLADEYALAADGEVEEWPADVPKTKWLTHMARLNARKNEGRWEAETIVETCTPWIGVRELECELGHYSGWGAPGPHGYTNGYVFCSGQSEEEVRKIATDAFWAKVAELDSLSLAAS